MFIIGDIEGHDKLCTRKAGHLPSMNGVTHSCNITRDKCDNPTSKCCFLLKHTISDLQSKTRDDSLSTQERKQCIDHLSKRGFYDSIKNAFFDMNFGCNPNGLHGAAAICLLHTFKQKFPNLVVEEYLKLFGVTEVTCGNLQINSSIPKFIRHCHHQSDCDFPLLNSFSFSLTKGKHTYSANEKYARVFALYLFSITTFGWEYMTNKMKSTYDEEDAKRIIACLEATLSIYQSLYTESFKISGKKHIEKEVVV